MFPPMVRRSVGAVPPGEARPISGGFFARLFLEARPVVPAVGCLSGLPFLHGFFHGKMPRNFPAIIPAKGFMRAVYVLFLGILTPPYSPSTAVKIYWELCRRKNAAKIPTFAIFAKNAPENLGKKISPVPP